MWLRTLAEQSMQNSFHKPHFSSSGQYSAPFTVAKRCEVHAGLAQLKEADPLQTLPVIVHGEVFRGTAKKPKDKKLYKNTER
jgi:hypothetical protein